MMRLGYVHVPNCDIDAEIRRRVFDSRCFFNERHFPRAPDSVEVEGYPMGDVDCSGGGVWEEVFERSGEDERNKHCAGRFLEVGFFSRLKEEEHRVEVMRM